MNHDATCIPGEGTRTWPDYLANRADQKNEEPRRVALPDPRPDPRPSGRESRQFFDFLGLELTFSRAVAAASVFHSVAVGGSVVGVVGPLWTFGELSSCVKTVTAAASGKEPV